LPTFDREGEHKNPEVRRKGIPKKTTRNWGHSKISRALGGD